MATQIAQGNNWQQLIEALALGVLIIDEDGKIIYANHYAANLFGYSPSSLIGSDFLYPLATKDSQEIEILQSDYTVLLAQMNVNKGAWKNQPAWIVSLLDISELKQKETLLSIAHQAFSSAFEGILITDSHGKILQVNKSFLTMFGFKKQDIIGKNPKVLHSGQHNINFYRELWQTLLKLDHWSGELWDKGNKKLLPIFLSISAVRNKDGDITNYIGFFRDLTILKDHQKKISRVEFFDVLTGLSNRFLLSKNLEQYMRKSTLDNNHLIILSIRVFNTNSALSMYSNFSKIWDALILQTVERIRNSAPGMQDMARTGYREFIIVYYSEKPLAEMSPIANRIIQAISEPYYFDNKKYRIQTIIGITQYQQSRVSSVEELLYQAEMARHTSFQTGKNTFSFFDPVAEIRTLEFNKLVESLRHAIQFNELEIHYQPKVDLKTAKVIGLEALLRWRHRTRGLLLPNQFFLHLDTHPISVEIGDWTLNAVLQQQEQFITNNLNVPISINISSYQLQSTNFTQKIETILAKYPHVPNQNIRLEILETEALENMPYVTTLIKECKSKGILFSLDDFGTGYSSLTYLKALDAVEVKIDQSFVLHSLKEFKDLAIIKTTIELCNMLGREVIAEGVETMVHGKLLMLLGCSKIQGYVISKPIPSKKLLFWLKHWGLDPKWNQWKFSKEELSDIINMAIKHYIEFQTIESFLMNNQLDLPDLDSKACPFTDWLNQHQERFADQHLFNKIHELHEKEHHLGKEIIAYSTSQPKKNVYKQLDKLNILKRQLLTKMIKAIF